MTQTATPNDPQKHAPRNHATPAQADAPKPPDAAPARPKPSKARRRVIRRHYLALLVFAVAGIVPALLHLFTMIGYTKLMRDGERTMARRIAEVFLFWTRIWFGCHVAIGGLRYRYEMEVGDYHHSTHGPVLVIANHIGAFDVALMSGLADRCGIVSSRGVSKVEVSRVWLLGRVLKAAKWCFVYRDKGVKDEASIRDFARQNCADGASSLIFPEGHIWQGAPKPNTDYRHVLPPSLKGVRYNLEEQPGIGILSVTINYPEPDFSHSWLDGVVPAGNEVIVSARYFPDVTPATSADFLRAEWQRKDAWLHEKRRNGVA